MGCGSYGRAGLSSTAATDGAWAADTVTPPAAEHEAAAAGWRRLWSASLGVLALGEPLLPADPPGWVKN